MGLEFPPLDWFSIAWLKEKDKVLTIWLVSETNSIKLLFA